MANNSSWYEYLGRQKQGAPQAFIPPPETPNQDALSGQLNAPAPAPLPKPGSTLGKYVPEGYDPAKLNSDHASPKYQVGRVLSNFDPRQGITPDVLAALNALGLGTFEGSGQKLRVGADASPEFQGYTGWGDMIHGYQGGAGENAAWQYGINNLEEQSGMNPNQFMAASAAMPATTPGMSSILSGDPLSRITQAIERINNRGQVNLDALLNNLQGS